MAAHWEFVARLRIEALFFNREFCVRRRFYVHLDGTEVRKRHWVVLRSADRAVGEFVCSTLEAKLWGASGREGRTLGLLTGQDYEPLVRDQSLA